MRRRSGAVSAAFSVAVLAVACVAHAGAGTIANGPLDPQKLEQGADGLVGIVVKLKDESLARYQGGVTGLAATSPATTGMRRLDPGSSSSRAYLGHVRRKLSEFETAARRRSPRARVTHRYDVVFGGVALRVPRGDVDAIAALPNVAAVYPDQANSLDMSRAPKFQGANVLWKKVGGRNDAGEGVVVGILDSGIWPEHPSFADPDPTGNPYPPPPVTLGAGSCQFSGGANPGQPFACNNKLIGARRFLATWEAGLGTPDPDEFTSARDNSGHGTHVASTVAGNANVPATIQGTARGKVTGIAPRAHVIAYKVCGEVRSGGFPCWSSDAAAAVQQAILDGVDVLNYSISGGNDPYVDVASLAFLDAYEAGIFIAASAGNNGPTASTVAHREPWVTTVAASSKDRRFASTLHLTANGGASLDLPGTTISSGITSPAPIVSAAAQGDALCEQSTADGAFAGEIVICRSGTIGFTTKAKNVQARGAVGMIFYGTASIDTLDALNHFVPTLQMQKANADSLLSFLGAQSNVQGTFAAGADTAAPGDVLASFSSRGGSGQTLGVSKPDLAAAGVQIVAAMSPAPAIPSRVGDELFEAISGTSMASPQVAGAAALLKDRNPSWTPGQIKSALMTTARQTVLQEDGITPGTPFDRGSGRIDLKRAFKPGLTFDVPASDFESLKQTLWKANLPSVYLPSFPGRATVERIARDVSGVGGEWQLQVEAPVDVSVIVPATITVPAGGETPFAITVAGGSVPVGQVRHATLKLVQTGTTDALVLPITLVRAQARVQVENTCAAGAIPVGGTTTCEVRVRNTTTDPVTGKLIVKIPRRLSLVAGSVAGGTGHAKSVRADLSALAAGLSIAPGTAPFGYVDFTGSACTPFPTLPNEWIYFGLNVDPFLYGGRQWTRMALTSNGYVIPGGGDVNDLTATNSMLPALGRPNNVLAPFWTNLDPTLGGEVRYCYYIGTNSQRWAVFDWRAVPNAAGGGVNSFQVWVGMNGVEDVTYAYGPQLTAGNATALTVGAENADGSVGATRYFKSQAGSATGSLPTANSALRVTTTPAEKIVTFSVTGKIAGSFNVCAEVETPISSGMVRKCFSGTVQ